MATDPIFEPEDSETLTAQGLITPFTDSTFKISPSLLYTFDPKKSLDHKPSIIIPTYLESPETLLFLGYTPEKSEWTFQK
jgi:hypothetical protein